MLRKVRLLFAKELLGAVRDRRTLILTVFFPLIFYPLVLSVMGHFGTADRVRVEDFVPTVIVVDRSGDETFNRELAGTDSFYTASYSTIDAGLAALKDGVGQLMIDVEKEGGGEGLGLKVTLYYDRSDQLAAIAAGRVRSFFEAYLKRVVSAKLDELGISYEDLSPPLTIDAKDVTSGESLGRMILSRLLPYFMVLAILTGAMGLGAEITAGEKERSTIATLLVSQLTRMQIVLGKFLTVLTVSLVSSLLIVVLVPLAVILAALVIIVGTYARSQKEASMYLLPVYMVIVLVGMVSMTGGTGFEGFRFLIPVANALYALQGIIMGDAAGRDLIYTLIANVACGATLIALSVKLFKREAVLFRS